MIGQKVYLRPIRLEDAAVLSAWKNDEATYKYLGGGYQPISLDQYAKWVENMIELTGTDRRFIIETFEKKPIGLIGLYDINWIHRSCEVGIFIGDQEEKGRGYASEAFSLLERYAASYLNLRKFKLKAVDENFVAKAFWEKHGFEVVGRLREERFVDGKYCDVFIMEKFIQPIAASE